MILPLHIRAVVARLRTLLWRFEQEQPSYPQPFYDTPMDEVLINQLIDILAVDPGIPNPLGIHHHARTLAAAVQAPSAIDAHPTWAR